MSRLSGGRAGVFFVIGLLALAPLILVVNRQVLLRKLAEERERIRREGYPVTLEDLAAWYPQPVGTNAADLYLEAFGLFDTWQTNKVVVMERPPQRRRPGSQPKEVVGDLVPVEKLKLTFLPIVGDANLPPVTEPLPNDMLVLAREYLQDNAATLERLHAAAKIEECHYAIDFSRGIDLLLTHISQLRQAARLLMIEAIVAAEDGDTERAKLAIESSLQAGKSLEREPLVGSQLVRFALHGRCLSALHRVLNRVEFTDAELATFQQLLANTEAPEALRRGFAGDRVLMDRAFPSPGVMAGMFGFNFFVPVPGLERLLEVLPLQLGDGVNATVKGFYKLSGLLEADQALFLSGMRQQIDAVQSPLLGRLAATAQVTSNVLNISQWCVLSRMALMHLERVVDKEAGCVAQIRVAMTGLAVERYRLRTGHLPESLTELVPQYLPALLVDPYTGDPLRYYRAERCFVVYSVGADRTDDGGREKDAKGRTYQPGTDITFSVER